MRLVHTFLGLSMALVACDLPDIGESDSTTSGGDSGPVTSTSTSVGSATVTSGDPTAPTDTTSPTAGRTCPPFDPGPVGDPHETYTYECFCDSCDLSFEDIPLETLQTFESDGLCDCLCAEAGCGGIQGEGGVATGSPPESDSDCAETDTEGSWPDTDGGTTDSLPETDGGTSDGG